MRKERKKPAARRITGQDLMVIAVGSSVLIWAGVLKFLFA